MNEPRSITALRLVAAALVLALLAAWLVLLKPKSSPAGVAYGGPGQAAGGERLARLAGGASADDPAFIERWPIKDPARPPGIAAPAPPKHHRDLVYLFAALAIAAVVAAFVLSKRET